MKSYSSKEVASITGINVRTIQFWCSEEIIVPDIGAYPKGGGRGKKLLFSQSNIIECMIVQELQRRGFLLKDISTIMEDTRRFRKKYDFCNPKEIEKDNIYIVLDHNSLQEIHRIPGKKSKPFARQITMEDICPGNERMAFTMYINKFLSEVKEHFIQ